MGLDKGTNTFVLWETLIDIWQNKKNLSSFNYIWYDNAPKTNSPKAQRVSENYQTDVEMASNLFFDILIFFSLFLYFHF